MPSACSPVKFFSLLTNKTYNLLFDNYKSYYPKTSVPQNPLTAPDPY